jgi:hypothetical protein
MSECLALAAIGENQRFHSGQNVGRFCRKKAQKAQKNHSSLITGRNRRVEWLEDRGQAGRG